MYYIYSGLNAKATELVQYIMKDGKKKFEFPKDACEKNEKRQVSSWNIDYTTA
jgi:hypothetical protein